MKARFSRHHAFLETAKNTTSSYKCLHGNDLTLLVYFEFKSPKGKNPCLNVNEY